MVTHLPLVIGQSKLSKISNSTAISISLIPPLSIVPQQGYTNPVDCPIVLLCTEDVVFELILRLKCMKSTGPGCASHAALKEE